MSNSNWFKDLFIDEAKSVVNKNKPFYSETVTKPCFILENKKLNYDGEDYYVNQLPTPLCFTEGDKVTIICSGSEAHEDITITDIAVPITSNPDRIRWGFQFDITLPDGARVIGNVQTEIIDNLTYVSFYNTLYPVVSIILPDVPAIQEIVYHQVEPQYLPNSVWLDEVDITLENPDEEIHTDDCDGFRWTNSFYGFNDGDNVELILMADEVPTTFTCVLNTSDSRIASHRWEDPYAEISFVPLDNGKFRYDVYCSYLFDTAIIKIKRTEVKTNCDLMLKAGVEYDIDNNSVPNIQLVQGNFATAKAKIQRGLNVTALVCCKFTNNNGACDIYNEVVPVYYFAPPDGSEYLYVNSYNSINIYSDNTTEP